jgi:hypothetical protein
MLGRIVFAIASFTPSTALAHGQDVLAPIYACIASLAVILASTALHPTLRKVRGFAFAGWFAGMAFSVWISDTLAYGVGGFFGTALFFVLPVATSFAVALASIHLRRAGH